MRDGPPSDRIEVRATETRPSMARSRRRWRPISTLFRAIVIAAVAVFVGGFVVYAVSLTDLAPPADPNADGIVVLTGGSDRIKAGVMLLGDGRGQRLLITGVNPAVDNDEIFRLIGTEVDGPAPCCIDIDREAEDTIGNATETRDWVAEHGYGSLIVVTSDYHMARALTEFAMVMPDVDMIAFPVPNTRADVTEWWYDGAAFRLVSLEYLKLVSTWVRRIGSGV